MDIEGAFAVSASALSAEKLRMNVIAGNLANVNSTRTPEGGPYRRKDVIFKTVQGNSFADTLGEAINNVNGVKVDAVIEDKSPFKTVYNPGHPDADKDGYLKMPNVNLLTEMVNMISASRAYEANVNAVQVTKGMIGKALEIGK